MKVNWTEQAWERLLEIERFCTRSLRKLLTRGVDDDGQVTVGRYR